MTTHARRVPSTHPVNMKLYDEAPLGVRIADGVTGFMGSWRFIVIQTVIVVIWIAGNAFLLFHFDPYPFILLNLAFSTQAAYAAPLILLAQNRQEFRDKVVAEQDRQANARAHADMEFLAREVASLRMSVGEVATRDFLRSELRSLLTDLEEPRERRHDEPQPEIGRAHV